MLIEVSGASAGPPTQVVLAGGGARSSLWRQIVADVFGVAVRHLLVTEQSALGAALLAGEGAGLLCRGGVAANAWARLGEAQSPNPAHQERYAELFALYQRAYAANRELMHALGNLTA